MQIYFFLTLALVSLMTHVTAIAFEFAGRGSCLDWQIWNKPIASLAKRLLGYDVS